jgi:hypothetical protein
MLDLFLNPWAMVAGTALISSPIIIHLINRMRFRRVRWAAMEFLLKSQKRNRRRIIIEQIILLLLRILLVLLAGFLLARFLGSLAGQQQNAIHVILWDDTLSNTDSHTEAGQHFDAFTQAKRIIAEDIAANAADATTPQTLVLIRLSELSAPRGIERLNASTVEDLRRHLADVECSHLHVSMAKGLDEAQAIFEQSPQERRLLHIVSDFRSRDWTGASSESIRQSLERIKAARIDVHLLDAAYPIRSEKVAVHHDNLAIVEFQPETRVVGRHMPTEFTVTVANYSNAERKNVRVTVRVKGQERAEGSFTLPSVPANTVTVGNFMVSFDQLGTNPVSVNLENEDAGLAIDNIRHAVVDVRERVPLLLIEGDVKTRGTQDGDAYFLQSLFSESTRGFDVAVRGVPDLEKLNLDQFPTIFLLNVPRLSDRATQVLEKYIRNGGGVAFFMGNEVKTDWYNKQYAEGKGFFPVLLEAKPTDPVADPGARLMKMLSNPLPKLYPRSESHPIFTRIYRDERSRQHSRENNKYLIFAGIDRHWQVSRAKWTPQAGVIDELITLPNSKAIADYSESANRVIAELRSDEERNAKFKSTLEMHRTRLREALLAGGDLYKLALPLDQLLNDTGVPNNPERPNLQEYWQQRERAELRERVQGLLEEVRYGDPYMVSRSFGKGRSLVCLSTANAAWNDMPNGPSRVYWVMLMVEVQKFLASSAADTNLALGTPLELDLDAARYEAKMRRFFPVKADLTQRGVPPKSLEVDSGDQSGEVNNNKLLFRFNEAKTPGVYRFVLKRKDAPSDIAPKTAPGKTEKTEEQTPEDTFAFAFNVDAIAESDLKRATDDDLAVTAPNIRVHRPGDGSIEAILKEKKSDLSESTWLYLLILIVLVAEQAMAVRLSHHVRGGSETTPTATTGAVAMPTGAETSARETRELASTI